jgi:hypothetical protein
MVAIDRDQFLLSLIPFQLERKTNRGRNPHTGQTIKIPAKKMPKFVPGKSLREKMKSEKLANEDIKRLCLS